MFERFDGVESVILYGSRTMGTYREGSDIDLSIRGKALDIMALNAISNELDDLLLPYKFDLSLYHYLQNQDIIDHIARVGIEFCRQKSPLSNHEHTIRSQT